MYQVVAAVLSISQVSGEVIKMNPDFNPRFLKKYMDGYAAITDALKCYVADVRAEMAARTRSFLPLFVLHWGIGVGNDLFCAARQGLIWSGG